MNKKFYYKVVSYESGEYFSAVIEKKVKVKYQINKTTKPPCKLGNHGYGLLVFKTLRDAKLFVENERRSNKKLIILKCKVLKIKNKLPPMLIPYHLERGKMIEQRVPWPSGSVMAECIIPVREVN